MGGGSSRSIHVVVRLNVVGESGVRCVRLLGECLLGRHIERMTEAGDCWRWLVEIERVVLFKMKLSIVYDEGRCEVVLACSSLQIAEIIITSFQHKAGSGCNGDRSIVIEQEQSLSGAIAGLSTQKV